MNIWQINGVARGGYCLGYHVVLQALREHSFDELLHMKRADAYALSKKLLAGMATP